MKLALVDLDARSEASASPLRSSHTGCVLDHIWCLKEPLRSHTESGKGSGKGKGLVKGEHTTRNTRKTRESLARFPLRRYRAERERERERERDSRVAGLLRRGGKRSLSPLSFHLVYERELETSGSKVQKVFFDLSGNAPRRPLSRRAR